MVTINNSINNTVGASNSGVTNTLTVQNPSNTASSAAEVLVTTGGTSAGDCYTQYTVGTTASFAAGISNGSPPEYRLTYNANATGTLTGTKIFRVDTSGNSHFTNSSLAIANENGGAAGNPSYLNIQNTNTAAGSDANINLQVSSSSGGNAHVDYTGPSNNWSEGVDKSDSSSYKITQGTTGAFPYSTVGLRISTAGAVSLPSAGFTTGGVVVASASGGGLLASTTAGTSGQVLTSNGTGVAPTFQNAGGSGTGSIVQQVRTSSTTATSTGTTLGVTTTPTTSNTTSLITLACTPTSATNVLIFEFSAPFDNSGTSGGVGFFLFAGSTFISAFPFVAAANSSATYGTGAFRYYAVSGTTSATTYAVYYAGIGTTAYILQNSSSTALYGGTGNTAIQFTITEVKP